MQLNERLKEIRLGKNLTQQEFADMTGVSKRSQADYEKSIAFPNAKYLMALHNAGYDVKYLLTGKHETTSLNPEQQQLIQCYQDASPEFREGAFDFFMVEQLQSPKADNLRMRANVLEMITGHRTVGELSEEETALLLQWKSAPEPVKRGIFNMLLTNWADTSPIAAPQNNKTFEGDVQIKIKSNSGDVAGRDINK